MVKSVKFLFLCLLSATIAGNAAEVASPARIQQLKDKLPCEVPLQGEFSCKSVSGDLKLYSLADEDVTVQIGVSLFSEKLKNQQDRVVCNCIERLWLELLLEGNVRSQAALLKQNGVRMVLGGYPLGTASFTSLDKALAVIRNMDSFSINVTDGTIEVRMAPVSGSVLKVFLPADRDLLFTWDKKEHEEWQARKLRSCRLAYSSFDYDFSDASDRGDGLQVSGFGNYMVESLSKELFLRNGSPVFDIKWPEESARNMLMGALPSSLVSGKTLNIRLRTYSKSEGYVSIGLGTFLAYMKAQGLEFYSGKYSTDGDVLTVMLAMYHPVYGYLDMLTVRIDNLDTFFGNRSQTLQADLLSFIPQSNIKNLFYENSENK